MSIVHFYSKAGYNIRTIRKSLSIAAKKGQLPEKSRFVSMTTKNAFTECARWTLPFGTSDVNDVQLVYVIKLNYINVYIATFFNI